VWLQELVAHGDIVRKSSSNLVNTHKNQYTKKMEIEAARIHTITIKYEFENVFLPFPIILC
jgi:hypothetical protein